MSELFPWQQSVRERVNLRDRAFDLGITKGLHTTLKVTGEEVVVLRVEHDGLVLGDRYGMEFKGRFKPEAIVCPHKVSFVNPDSS